MGTAEKRHQGGHPHREFILALHDFALLFDGEGKPLNPPEHPGSDDDPGVMGINYRCEPMPERLKRKNDPAHIFSSFCYGDPATPILETYPGEPMVIRLLDGAHKEQHILNITGLPWRKEITAPASLLVQAQAIGISEAFNLRIDQPYGAGDYLYYSGGIDDLYPYERTIAVCLKGRRLTSASFCSTCTYAEICAPHRFTLPTELCARCELSPSNHVKIAGGQRY